LILRSITSPSTWGISLFPRSSTPPNGDRTLRTRLLSFWGVKRATATDKYSEEDFPVTPTITPTVITPPDGGGGGSKVMMMDVEMTEKKGGKKKKKKEKKGGDLDLDQFDDVCEHWGGGGGSSSSSSSSSSRSSSSRSSSSSSSRSSSSSSSSRRRRSLSLSLSWFTFQS